MFLKKTFLLPGFLILVFSVNATAQKGTWMVYGDGGYDNQSYSANSNSPGNYAISPLTLVSWSVNPGIGYEFSNHFMIGLQGGYGRQNGVGEYTYSNYGGFSIEEERYREVDWQMGIFARYTSWIGKRFYVYGQLFAGKYGTDVNPESVYPGNGSTPYFVSNPSGPEGNGFVASLVPAIGMNIIRGYGIHMDIGGVSYNAFNTIDEGGSDLHHFNITLGQQFTFGIHKIIGWKKFNTSSPKPDATK